MPVPEQAVGWGGRMTVMACPCGYYDTGDQRICPECGVGLLMEVEVQPVETPDPYQQVLQQAVAEGLMEVTDDGRYRVTEKGREAAAPDDPDAR